MGINVIRPLSKSPLVIASIYGGASAAWIFFTDKSMDWLHVNSELIPALSLAKGMIYVAICGILIYLILVKLQRANQNLECLVGERTETLAQREIELHKQAGLLRTFIDEVPAGLAMFDRNMRYIEASARWCREHGLNRSEIIGKSHYEVFPNLPERWKDAHRRGLAGETVAKDNDSFVDLNNREHKLRWAIRPWGDSGTNTGGIIIFTEDITEQHQLHRQLQQAQKMEAVGNLAGGVAHDFNNLLGIIMGYSDLSLASVANDSQVHRNLQQIKKASDRAASLTRQLLAFGRRQVVFPKVLDLDTVIQNTTKMLLRLVSEDIEIAFVHHNQLGYIKADPSQIDQILMNLVVNARDAMPNGGKIEIRTAEAKLESDYAAGHPGCRPGDYISLSVSDTGCGMNETVKSKIFEPFFTTKELGKGTGLGLSTVYGIVKQSGGYIAVDSEPGKGTTFQIFFPKLMEPDLDSFSSNQPRTLPRGSETILIVEDNQSLRELAVAMLQGGGYRVLDANDAEHAMTLLHSDGQNVDLLITDVIMPGQNGAELVNRAQEAHPRIKALFISGHPGDVLLQRGGLDPEATYLEKPFTTEVLLTRVDAILHPAN